MNKHGFSHTLLPFEFLLSLLLLQYSQPYENNNSFSVAVRCSDNAMEMFVQFREPFNGRLKTRPDGRCFVNGRGRITVGFRLPLDEKHRRKCSIIRRTHEFVAIVDLEMSSNSKQVTAEDNASYFVRCPIVSTDAEHVAIAEHNVTANFSSVDADMRQLREGGPSLKLLALDGQGGQKARLQKCLAIFNLADTDGKVQAVPLGNPNECAQNQVHIWPPFFDDQNQQQQQYGKFMLQCEVVIGGEEAQEKLCPNSTIPPLLHHLTGNAREALQIPPSLNGGPSLEQLLLAALLGVLFSLGLACLCLVAVHFLGHYRDRKVEGGSKFLGVQPSSKRTQKHVQIVCPTSHSALSLNSSALSFGSSPILPPTLQCHPPPRSHNQCFSPLSSGASSPTSTVTTALALSLDKLPEPPSLSLAEIRQLNLAFNGLLLNNGKWNQRDGSDASSGVYSFAGIRLNSQFMSMDNQSVEDGRTEEDVKPAKYF